MADLISERLEVDDDFEAVQDLYLERGWTDGLPVVPPTTERVEAMLAATPLSPQDIIGEIPPNWGSATVEKLAVNAVMAGCRPEYLPVVIAAVEAMCDEVFNLYAIQATTHPCAPLIIVNGPICEELGLHGGSGAFGPGWQPNATIGRAVRLVQLNVGGAHWALATCPPRARLPSTPTAWPRTWRPTRGSRSTSSVASGPTKARLRCWPVSRPTTSTTTRAALRKTS